MVDAAGLHPALSEARPARHRLRHAILHVVMALFASLLSTPSSCLCERGGGRESERDERDEREATFHGGSSFVG
ncbi:MAG: hypothetical protein U0353_09990 [Sandaracinus sp.]